MTSEELSTTFSQKNAIGFVLGFVFFFILIAMPTPQSFIDSVRMSIGTILNDKEIFQIAASMQKVLALLSLMIIWWVTEAIPIPAVALLPEIMLPLLQVVGWSDGHLFEFTFQKTLVNYANPVIGLFLGCFFLAGGMQKWGIDKRITLWLLSKGKIASSPQLTLLVMMYTTAFISMWVSNTATTAIMLPIGVGILAQNTIDRSKNKFGTALMLGIAWSASVGGIGTIIGMPPNGIAISILRQSG